MKTEELEIWKKLNECECVKKIKKGWYIGDRFMDPQTEQILTIGEETAQQDDIWIPPLYDLTCPKRSLIGIAKSVKLHENRKYDLKQLYYQDRPDLALAQAIIEQEGK